MSDTFQNRAMQCCPMGDWPKRKLVELDYLGDPGGWLVDWFSEIEEGLRGKPEDVVRIARMLADEYYCELCDKNYYQPADYADDDDRLPQDDIEVFEEEFFQFMVEWRRRMTP